MKVYTKTGDSGETELLGGVRVRKSHLRVDLYGTLDELNSQVGFFASLLSEQSDKPERNRLEQLQSTLFDLGTEAAQANASKTSPALSSVKKVGMKDVEVLEDEIDSWTSELKPLANFILPGGSLVSSACHLCRVVTRKAERKACLLTDQEGEGAIRQEVLIYLNRLSDWFFTLARYLSFKHGTEEKYWQPRSRI